MAAHGEPVVGWSLRLPSEFSGRRPLGVTSRTGLEVDVRPAQPRATTTIHPAVLDALIAPRVAMFSHRCRGRALGYRATRTPADGRARCLVSCDSEPGSNRPRLERPAAKAMRTPTATARRSGSGSTHPGTMRVEAGTVAEHRAGDVQQAVGHRAQGARVSVAPGAQRLVLAVADRITLDGDARPIEDGVAQSVVGRPPLYHEQTLARTPGDRCHPAQTAKCVVVPPPHRVAAFSEKRGEHPGTDAGRRRAGLLATLARPPSTRPYRPWGQPRRADAPADRAGGPRDEAGG